MGARHGGLPTRKRPARISPGGPHCEPGGHWKNNLSEIQAQDKQDAENNGLCQFAFAEAVDFQGCKA